MTNNRLIVLGSKRDVASFQASNWDCRPRARYCELLERSKGRYASQFMTETPPVRSLTKLSRRWPNLILLLDYEIDRARTKGLAKACAGKLEHWETNY